MGIAWQLQDFEMDDVEQMVDELYAEIKPFYEQIHAFVRRRLISAYPGRNINPRGPIPAHLLGEESS